MGSQCIETAEMKRLREEKELKKTKNGGERDDREESGRKGPSGRKEVCTCMAFIDSFVNQILKTRFHS